MRKKTIRRLSPTTRKLAKLVNECNSIAKRLQNLLPTVSSLENDSKALQNHRCPTPQSQEEIKL